MLLNNNALQIIGEKTSYESHQFAFGGLGEIYDRFMMDVSGVCGIPVTKLFGRSPTGMNATGELDMQNYYDLIEKEQETRLRPVLENLLPIIFTSVLGAVPNDLDFNFNPVRRSNEAERQDLGSKQTTAVTQAFTAGLISQRTALKELQGSSKQTGMWTNITDNDIDNADDDITAVGKSGLGNLFGDGSQVTDADFKEEEYPRNKSGKFTSKGENTSTNSNENGTIEPSAQGANKLTHREFRSRAVFNNHWNKHNKEFLGEFKNKEEYLDYAVNLLESPTSDKV